MTEAGQALGPHNPKISNTESRLAHGLTLGMQMGTLLQGRTTGHVRHEARHHEAAANVVEGGVKEHRDTPGVP